MSSESPITYWIGADEAGYGPKLGPLVIAASVWRVDPAAGDACRDEAAFHRRLAPLIVDQPTAASARDALCLADSKRLHSPGHWAGLERGVLAALGVLGHWPRPTTDWLAALAPEIAPQHQAAPWARVDWPATPRDAPAGVIEELVEAWRRQQRQGGVALCGLRARVLFPAEFNAGVARAGNKANLLSQSTLELIRELLADKAGAVVRVRCDKHGGRNRYAAVLQSVFSEHWITTRHESRAASVYAFGADHERREFEFRVEGEQFAPIALASMAAKYTRELAMDVFNRFWQAQLPGLRPTAGYPQDALRFLRETMARQKELGIDDNVVWRTC